MILRISIILLHVVGIILFLVAASGCVCIKIRTTTACNCLVLYYMILTGFDVIFALLLQFNENWIDHFNEDNYFPDILWLLAAVTFVFVIIKFLFHFKISTAKPHDHFEKIHCADIFEFGNFALFWMCFFLMSVCSGWDCSVLKSPLTELASGFAGILLAVTYILLLLCSIFYTKRQNIKIISKREAIIILTEKRQNVPSLDWHIACSKFEEGFGKSFSLLRNEN